MKVLIIIILSIIIIGGGAFFLLSNGDDRQPTNNNGDVVVNNGPPVIDTQHVDANQQSGGVSVNSGSPVIGTQHIDADQQSGGVDTITTHGDANIIVESEAVNKLCKPSHSNKGMLKADGYNGPLCKKPAAISRKIKREKCVKKGKFIHQNMCVMEWVQAHQYWRVRLLKD